jgi:hypothetical protein
MRKLTLRQLIHAAGLAVPANRMRPPGVTTENDSNWKLRTEISAFGGSPIGWHPHQDKYRYQSFVSDDFGDSTAE